MQVQIGPILYDVLRIPELASDAGSLCGDFSFSRARIRINADDDPQCQVVTLWHEVIHGILYTAGLRDHDEQIIDALAHGLVQVLSDNPEIVPFRPVAPRKQSKRRGSSTGRASA